MSTVHLHSLFAVYYKRRAATGIFQMQKLVSAGARLVMKVCKAFDERLLTNFT